MKTRRPTDFAFTLIEMLAATGVLILVVGMIGHLCQSAQVVTGMGHRRMDADGQARAVFDRMAMDFAQMVQRPDVDYYLKDSTHRQPGNDQIAFFSHVPGYYPSTGSKSPLSLVGYRVHEGAAGVHSSQMERYGEGFVWAGDRTGNPSMPFLPLWIANQRLCVTDQEDDNHYEPAGPQIFRWEYYYVLREQEVAGTVYNSRLSETPWDARIQGIDGVENHAGVEGLRDVAAIGVVIAVIDPKTETLLTPQALSGLAAALEDFDSAEHAAPGALEARWQEALNRPGLPAAVRAGVHIYRRWFSLKPGASVTP